MINFEMSKTKLNPMGKNLFNLILLTLFSYHLAAQTRLDTVKKIQHIFSQYQPGQPGCQLAISLNGKLIYSGAWGVADIEHQALLSTTSLIEAGSVSKQFTAAAILLLAQEGKLSLADDLRKYIPEIPVYDTTITLGHMLHHTSGLKDWGTLMSLSDWPRGTKVYTNAEVLNIMSRQGSLNFRPGSEYAYSNSNYVLLAIIVERVSGHTLAEFTREKIFKPAGMIHTQWRTDIRKIVHDRAIAYGREGDAYFTDMPNENVYGNAGLLTTAEDLLRWNNFYALGKLGRPSILAEQLHTVRLSSGKNNNYAAGLRVDSIAGRKVISHDGATAGYRSLLEYYPGKNLSIAWLSNTSAFDDNPNMLDSLRQLFFSDPVKVQAAAQKSRSRPANEFKIDSAALQDYLGNYSSDEIGADLSITLVADKLVINRRNGSKFTMVPTAIDHFAIEDSSVSVMFERGKKRKVTALAFTTPRVRHVIFYKILR